jgi:Rps23 Pro-64 3,4-dihydroxylase Tpa1-like proline 4-hydroxylase
MNDKEYNNFIFVKENVLSSEICGSIIKRLEADSNLESTSKSIHRHLTSSYGGKTLGILVTENTSDWIDIFGILENSLNSYLREYVEKTNIENLNQSKRKIYFPYCHIQKILEGGFYSPHFDCFTEPSEKTKRVITCIWYLNDVENGGETHFLKTGFKIKPKTGRLGMFPSDKPFIHEGLPPIGTKYIISCWLEIDKSFHYAYS